MRGRKGTSIEQVGCAVLAFALVVFGIILIALSCSVLAVLK